MTDSIQSHPLLLSTNESSPSPSSSNAKHHHHHNTISTSPINQQQQTSSSSAHQSLLPSSSSSISSSYSSSNLKASTSTSVLTTDTTTLSTIKSSASLTNNNQGPSPNQYFTTYPTRRNISTPSRNRNYTSSNYSTFSHSSLEQNSQSSTPLATDALLFQSLRAEAQSLGLEPDSLGWAILRHLSSSSSRPIRALLHQLSSFNLLLILPRAINPQSDSQSNLSQETVYDHLILLSSLDDLGSACCFSSLTGWKGLLEGDRLLVSSPGKSLSTLQNHSHLDPSSLIPTIKPSTSLSSELTAPSRLRLPLYSLTSSSSHTLTLPGLPSTRPHSINTNTTTQRLASLFGPRSTPAPSSLPDSSSSEVEPADEPIQLKVRILSCSTLTSELLDQAVSDAVRNRIRDGLGSLEESVLDSIDKFIDRFAVHDQKSSLFLAPKNVIGDCLQSLYHTIQSELEEEYGHDEGNVIVDHTLELVEETLCVELYERLFEDDHDDEGLSEKIAGLNLLDVTLDHLGLDLERRQMDDPDRIWTIKTGLEQIVQSASTELSRLQDTDCRSPRDKLAVCVRVHKLIVDGLATLPSIPIKKDGPGPLQETSRPSSPASTVEMTTTTPTKSHRRGISSSSLPTPTPLRPRNPIADLTDALETELKIPQVSLAPEEPKKSEDESEPEPEPSSGKSSSSTDLILPILIYMIIKSNPINLISNLRYIRRNRYKQLLKGESDYCLVNFEVACSFIQSKEKPADEEPKEVELGGLEGMKKEEGLGAAKRVVSELLVGGYQRVLGLELDDVKGFLRREDSGQRKKLFEFGNGNEEKKRRSGIFKSEQFDPLSSSLPSSSTPSSTQPSAPQDGGMRVSLGERLSSFHGLGSKKSRQNLSMSSKECVIDQEDLDSTVGPIERFEKCNGAEGLVMGDIALLVKDYQRLARIGRKAGIWK